MSRRLFFGVDVGATFTKIALVDDRGRFIAKSRISSRGFSNKAVFVKSIKSGFNSILRTNDLSFSQVKAIGIGLPGPVDFKCGKVLSLTNIKGWRQFRLRAYLKRYFSIPVFIENDANCMALAEVRTGAARGSSYALCLTLGTGVGAGLVLAGDIYRSPYFLGGEIGHIPISHDGPACRCGGYGCLERYVGNSSLLKKARRTFRKNITLEEVSKLAASGNKKAKVFWRETGCVLGLAISGVVNVFNPQIIVIGGGVAGAGKVLLRSIEKTVRHHAMRQLKHKVKIRKAALGNDAGVWGAALLAKENLV